jgi:arylformamidase
MKSCKWFLLSTLALLLAGCFRPNRTDAGMVIYQNIPYATIQNVDPNLLSLDVYAPNGVKDLPVILMIHGGGWSIGDKATPDVGTNKATYFTAQGYVYVSINYRLSPDVQHPAHIQDVAAAVSWVLENIDDYGGDPAQLTLMGHSAGAHLAALLATDERYLAAHGHTLSELSGVVLLDGAGYDIPLVLNELYTSQYLLQLYADAFGTDLDTWLDASPVTHVAPEKGIPSFLILHTRRTAAMAESEELAALLQAAGVPAWTYLAEGKTHASINDDIGDIGDDMTEQIKLFLENQDPYRR